MSVPVKVSKDPVEVLLIEDNPGDVLLMKEIVKNSSFPIYLSVANDGPKALEMLRLGEDFAEKGKPNLIILDLKLPRMTGHEVLAVIRRDPVFKKTPVLIMSSSQADEDIQTAYDNAANFYMVKPMDLDHFSEIMKFIEVFFLEKMN